MGKIDDILRQVRSEVGSDFIATDVVAMDGLSIAGLSADPNFDSEAASARYALVMKLGEKVADKIQMGGVEDMLATTDQGHVLSRFLGNGSYFWVMAVTKDSTLGMVRLVMNEYAGQIWDAIA